MDIGINDIFNDGEGVLNGLSDGERLRLSKEAERELGKRSTYYLAKYILGYSKLSDDFHLALCRFYDRHLYDLQLHLHPRKHFKTTLITISGKIRLALLDPNITICIIANTLHNSQTFLKEIRAHYVHNDKFRGLYPEHAVQTKREEGTTDRFTTPARTNFTERMETFEAASADRAIVSRHYKLMSFDDFVDDKNTATPELNRKLYENYATSLSVTSLTKQGRPWHHIVGTRWNYDDPYARILDENARSHLFQTLITQAYWKDKDEHGNTVTRYLFPEEFPPEALEYLRKSQGDYRFSCLYLNDPVPEGAMSLDPSYLRDFDDTIPVATPRHRIITIDPSSSVESRKGDPTVIGCYECDFDHNIYVKEIRRGWWNPDEIIEQLFDAIKCHKVREVFIETVAFQRWLKFYIEKEKKEKGLYFRPLEIKRSSHVSKNERLDRIGPFLRAGKIHVRKDEPERDVIRREMREYPYGRYDDILDTLADAIEKLRPPSTKRKRENAAWQPPVRLDGVNFQTGYSTWAAGR